MKAVLGFCAGASLCLSWAVSAWADDPRLGEANAHGRECTASRMEAITQLVGLLDNEEFFAVGYSNEAREQTAKAVELLGRLRAEKAIPILLEHIDFEWPISFHGPGLPDFPCAVALVRIGSMAAPQLVKLMAGDDNAAFVGTMVLVNIDGAPLAAARLRQAAEHEVHEERKNRLLAAVDHAAACRPQSLDRPKGPAQPMRPKGPVGPLGPIGPVGPAGPAPESSGWSQSPRTPVAPRLAPIPSPRHVPPRGPNTGERYLSGSRSSAL